MLIGLDLDNTIVCYDVVFALLASELGLPEQAIEAGKRGIRDYLRQQNREDEWTMMQGKAYGLRMKDALPFEGVIEFIESARDSGHNLCIVSHRTKQPFLGDPVDLHAAAKEWLADRGIDRLAPVFLEETASSKAARIDHLGCDVFIDDLPEFLARPDFPAKTRKVHFSPGEGSSEFRERVASWAEVSQLLLKS